MELAGQWRREWAGTAEYGKVTEGGVTRRVARAMEVLHASGPNAKVRVMRAAYHSTSGPGHPASSYMLHSSRRVISSGFNLLDSPTYPSKPLEISSTPLDSSPDYNTETENYKVTEPDDTEISEPSKWRGTSTGNNIRMPSEESSSTDNASIIDLSHNGLNRKYSYDSENSDTHLFKRSSARVSPLLDDSATLSTLKYKSLLNGSNSTSDWNNRRKSYSFENTTPLNETIVHSNETLAMESSTDSGICKSSEIVNEYPEESENSQHDKTFEEWRRKNKQNIIHNDHKFRKYNNHNFDIRDSNDKINNVFNSSTFNTCNNSNSVTGENQNITLQSSGKVCITVPITLEYDENSRQPLDYNDRKIKKVGFCKTELHFAAESGKVNIIATDEKPPSTNDFRKRRSAFVPISTQYEKPITLFGEKSDYLESNSVKNRESSLSNFIENDENTAATKSILKNKIPKPKPYLLGENMAFGDLQTMKSFDETSAPIGVSIINKQLQSKSDNSDKSSNKHSNISNKSFINLLRTGNNSPSNEHGSGFDGLLKMSPVNRTKTRQLRENELIYFGIDHDSQKTAHATTQPQKTQSHAEIMDTFESVRLVKQASSAQNSEAESDDAPEYQNLPMKSNFAPVPTPRSRVKYKKPNESVVILKPIIEQHNDTVAHDSRRSRSRKQDVGISPTCRSLSEPAKKRSDGGITRLAEIRSSVRKDSHRRYKENSSQNVSDSNTRSSDTKSERLPQLQSRHLYENINKKEYKENVEIDNTHKCDDSGTPGRIVKTIKKAINKPNDSQKKEKSVGKHSRIGTETLRTEKLTTPECIYPKNQDAKREPTYKSSKNSTLQSLDSKQARINKQYAVSSQDNCSTKKQETHKKTKKETAIDNTMSTSSINRTRIMPPICLEKQEHSNTENKKHEISRKGGSNENIAIETPRNSTIKKGPYKNTKSGSIESNNSNHKSRIDKDSSTNGRKSSRKSEYVIKYDDKNGTVSSVCKVRGRHDTSRHKHVSKERNRDQSKESKDKSGLRNAAPRSSQACKRKNNKENEER